MNLLSGLVDASPDDELVVAGSSSMNSAVAEANSESVGPSPSCMAGVVEELTADLTPFESLKLINENAIHSDIVGG